MFLGMMRQIDGVIARIMQETQVYSRVRLMEENNDREI